MQRLTDAVSGLKLCGELSDLDTASRRFCAGRVTFGGVKVCAVLGLRVRQRLPSFGWRVL
jgi:hypothetical protein